MKIGAAVLFTFLLQVPAHACDLAQADACKDVTSPPVGRLARVSSAMLAGPAGAHPLFVVDERTAAARTRLAVSLGHESAFARAIARAAKRSAVELALEASTKIIIMCQKERSPAFTTPFFRSDSQQAHCFRY